ncbi:GyrI-like domain-containing protein [Streptomyces sp. BE20]|uniref:AraC family transcriptional regulator n=1 Tax=Streptomyces sp. BE20 TaxID=3002525 RepID=UPI002E7717F3|nr:GyrI-like domain-containing protein [Streptomyces sp. BE20]MEE1822784.1 GyrI-like domain-containing protein [Streptomyces sp. BE20]
MFTVEDIPEFRIAYLRHVGPYGPGNAAPMERLKEWATTNGLFRADSVVLGIARDDPARTTPQNCRYDACLVLPQDAGIPHDEVEEALLAGGRHAVLVVPHTPEGLSRAWAGLFRALTGAGFGPDPGRPILERYRPQMLDAHLCEICVPVLPC